MRVGQAILKLSLSGPDAETLRRICESAVLHPSSSTALKLELDGEQVSIVAVDCVLAKLDGNDYVIGAEIELLLSLSGD